MSDVGSGACMARAVPCVSGGGCGPEHGGGAPVSGHHAYLTSSRAGAYAHCECGESFGPYRRVMGASFAWAKHLAEKALRREGEPQ